MTAGIEPKRKKVECNWWGVLRERGMDRGPLNAQTSSSQATGLVDVVYFGRSQSCGSFSARQER